VRPVLIVLCAVLLSGCGWAGRAFHRQSNAPGTYDKQSVVLLRVVVEANDQPVDTLQWWKLTATGGSALDVTALDVAPTPSRLSPTGLPSGDPQQIGWFTFALAPGTYHVQFVPPHRSTARRDPHTGRWDRRAGEPDPTYWFRVAGDEPALYVGSLYVSCTGPFGLGPLGVLTQCGAIRLVDESEPARRVSAVRPVITTLMQEYGEALATPPIDQLLPLRLVAASTETVNPPPWVMRGVEQAMNGDPEKGDQPWWVRVGMQGLASGLGLSGVGLPVLIAYEAAAAGSGAIVGGLTAAQWQPCVDGLAQAVRTFDVGAEWAASFPRSPETVVPPDQVDTVDAKSVLQTELRRVQLRECQQRDTFAVEVAVRARLWDVATTGLLFDETLRYGNAAARTSGSEHAAYEVPLPGTSPCRTIEAYCAPPGRTLFTGALRKAVATAAERVARDLTLEPAAGGDGSAP